MKQEIQISDRRDIDPEAILELYRANQWSAAQKPDVLCSALKNSHTLLTAWDGIKLAGLGKAIYDGYLVVYYPHLIVHPDYRRKGIGRRIMEKMRETYGQFHMQILTADK